MPKREGGTLTPTPKGEALEKTTCVKIYLHVQKEGVKESYKSNLHFNPRPKGGFIKEETSMCSSKRRTEARNGNTNTIAATVTSPLVLRVSNTETCDQRNILIGQI